MLGPSRPLRTTILVLGGLAPFLRTAAGVRSSFERLPKYSYNHACVYIHMYIHMYAYAYMYMYVCMYVCVFKHIRM